MSEDYLKKADEWFERGKQEDDIFVRFILFYISYEVLLKIQGLDKYRLNNYIRKEFFKNIDKKILEDLKIKLDRKPLENMKPGFNEKVKLNDINDFESILKFINIGRNNLFHGDKSLGIERDRMIVNFGSQILEVLLAVMNRWDGK